MRRLKHIVVACLCLSLVSGLVTPRPAKAQWLVYDAVNWIENATQVIQQVYEIYQQYEQLINDYQRYATMVKNLERFDELSFRSLVGLAVAVNDIIQYGESLGHTLDDIDAQFAETVDRLAAQLALAPTKALVRTRQAMLDVQNLAP